MNIEINSFSELTALRDALGNAPISSPILSMLDKVDAAIAELGYKREYVAKPKDKFQKKTYYEVVYKKIEKVPTTVA
jgi:hypothetical protein